MRPWPGRGVRGPGMLARAVVARAASCAARGHSCRLITYWPARSMLTHFETRIARQGHSRAYLLLALEHGVLGSTLEGAARGHDQVYGPCKFYY